MLERGAAAAEKALEKRFEAERAGDAGFDLGELSGGELFPAWTDGSIVAEAAKKELDLGEGKAHLAREANEQDAVEGVRGIAALTSGTVRRGEQAEFLVVADGRGMEASAAGEFTNLHVGPLSMSGKHI